MSQHEKNKCYTERAQFQTLERLDTADDWFDVYRVTDEITAICEPGNFQEVISYLIQGKERALLFDTGMGIGDISKVVYSLTDLPVMVLNSHSHYDHIGNNYKFEDGYILDTPASRFVMENGFDHSLVKGSVSEGVNVRKLPEAFDPDSYCTHPAPHWNFIQSGSVFDLGDMALKVISTPGHSSDSIMLEWKEKKILFTGDTYYPGPLYTHIPDLDSEHSGFDVYRDTMHCLAANYFDYTLIASHNEPLRQGSELIKVAEAFDHIAEGSAEYTLDEEELKNYCFDGFSIVTL